MKIGLHDPDGAFGSSAQAVASEFGAVVITQPSRGDPMELLRSKYEFLDASDVAVRIYQPNG